ncbi:autoinhibited Ca2+-ATPase 11 [Prunus dulcis]|uniref:Autoinhibited Ca2+-ATPase 11 n=1 Tax=Prunus dulcis TaxID=3755 RepID=A0A4Y1QPC8_PRUDU|nr:autoinhibited Ca2+-ATPase 11 [Prunus dulcis]
MGSINRDENLLAAALCFWNSASNTFDFRVGPMAQPCWIWLRSLGSGPMADLRKNQEKVATPFTIPPATINQNCSFSNYLKRFSTEKDKDQQHMLFLLYWLNRFVFPNRSSAVLLEYRHLAEALHNHTDVGLGPTVLAYLFKNLHTDTLENPLNLSAPGAFWMIQIWLQVYFPELRFPDIVLPENQVLALPLISAEVPKRSLEEYLMFFRHCTKRSAAQWQVVIRRTYPWFQIGFRLFEKEPEDEAAITDFRKKFLSITLPRDLPHVNKINNSTDALYPSWEPNSCSSADFDTWWHTRFQNLSASVTALKVLFDGWENWLVFADGDARAHMIQTIKDINAQIIEVSSVIAAGDLELPSADEEDDVEAEQTPAEAVPSGRRKRKGPAPLWTILRGLVFLLGVLLLLLLKGEVEYFTAEEAAAIPATTSGRMMSCEKPLRRWSTKKSCKSWKRCPREGGSGGRRAESIALAQKQQKGPSAELTSSELALFEDAEAEHSTAAPEAEDQVEPSASDPVDQAELTVVVPEAEVGTTAAAPVIMVEVPKATGALAAVPSPLKPPIVAMPIHSFPGSSATASFADPELEEFEAMDLDAQLDRLEKLSSPPSKAKSRAVQEAMERLKIWQSTELEFDEDTGALDQLMKDLDLLHRQNMAPRPILEMA